MLSKKNGARGQGLVEYALILVLVALIVIAVVVFIGPWVGNVFSSINSCLGGSCGTHTPSPKPIEHGVLLLGTLLHL